MVENGQTAGIALILVFGAGTDDALLLVARYREAPRRHESRYESMRRAIAGAAPAILASAATVILALLVVTPAEVNSTAGLGPLSALGVCLAMISSLTLLPALLLIGGRRAFWPFVPHAGDEGADSSPSPPTSPPPTRSAEPPSRSAASGSSPRRSRPARTHPPSSSPRALAPRPSGERRREPRASPRCRREPSGAGRARRSR